MGWARPDSQVDRCSRQSRAAQAADSPCDPWCRATWAARSLAAGLAAGSGRAVPVRPSVW